MNDHDEDDEDVLAALRRAGFPINSLSDEQRQVFRGLTADELSLLIDIKARLDSVEPEVQAHNVVAGAALF